MQILHKALICSIHFPCGFIGKLPGDGQIAEWSYFYNFPIWNKLWHSSLVWNGSVIGKRLTILYCLWDHSLNVKDNNCLGRVQNSLRSRNFMLSFPLKRSCFKIVPYCHCLWKTPFCIPHLYFPWLVFGLCLYDLNDIFPVC